MWIITVIGGLIFLVIYITPKENDLVMSESEKVKIIPPPTDTEWEIPRGGCY